MITHRPLPTWPRTQPLIPPHHPHPSPQRRPPKPLQQPPTLQPNPGQHAHPQPYAPQPPPRHQFPPPPQSLSDPAPGALSPSSALSLIAHLRTSSRRLWTAVRITALTAHGVRLPALPTSPGTRGPVLALSSNAPTPPNHPHATNFLPHLPLSLPAPSPPSPPSQCTNRALARLPLAPTPPHIPALKRQRRTLYQPGATPQVPPKIERQALKGRPIHHHKPSLPIRPLPTSPSHFPRPRL